ncbi:hypothetical protein DMENIID0001_061310 [Sergentomyia squamirostris]
MDLFKEQSTFPAIPEDYEFDFDELDSMNCHQSDDYVISHVSGYIAKRLSPRLECKDCCAGLSDSSEENMQKPRNQMTRHLSKGFLTYPSDELFNLIREVDGFLSQIVSDKMEAFSILHTMLTIEQKGVSAVGCRAHTESITSRVIQIYLCCRAKMLCKSYKQVHNKRRSKKIEKEN